MPVDVEQRTKKQDERRELYHRLRSAVQEAVSGLDMDGVIAAAEMLLNDEWMDDIALLKELDNQLSD